MYFVPFPGLSCLGDQVLGEHTVSGRPCVNHLPGPGCLFSWNVRSMNQGKLEVVKQEMARVNVNILGISKQKWTGMGEFNSDDHYTY